jgi:drug/metabolite transporter (DMT)-like permease
MEADNVKRRGAANVSSFSNPFNKVGSMTVDDPGSGRLSRGMWLAVAASAVAGVANIVSRPDIGPGDLVLPIAIAVAITAVILVLRFVFPQAVSDPVRNTRVFFALSAALLLGILVFGIWQNIQ